jgi:hypothetical protein
MEAQFNAAGNRGMFEIGVFQGHRRQTGVRTGFFQRNTLAILQKKKTTPGFFVSIFRTGQN